MSEPACNGCERSMRAALPAREVERLLAGYLAWNPGARIVDDATYATRLAMCRACPDLTFAGTTCRHCGCLVGVRAKLAEKSCAAPRPRWFGANVSRSESDE